MRNKCVQMSLYDTYKCVAASMEDDKPKLFRQLDEHIDWDSLIPARFYLAFYRNIGRPRKYPLVAFLKSLVLQKIFGYVNDSVLLVTLRHSREMRNFCGFERCLMPRNSPDSSRTSCHISWKSLSGWWN